MHLVFQGKVKSDMLHSFLTEGLCAWLIFLLLDVLDHVREPHRQTVVAATYLELEQMKEAKEVNVFHRIAKESLVYLKDMVNQTAMSMKVVRLYSGLKQARMLFRICQVDKKTYSF